MRARHGVADPRPSARAWLSSCETREVGGAEVCLPRAGVPRHEGSICTRVRALLAPERPRTADKGTRASARRGPLLALLLLNGAMPRAPTHAVDTDDPLFLELETVYAWLREKAPNDGANRRNLKSAPLYFKQAWASLSVNERQFLVRRVLAAYCLLQKQPADFQWKAVRSCFAAS